MLQVILRAVIALLAVVGLFFLLWLVAACKGGGAVRVRIFLFPAPRTDPCPLTRRLLQTLSLYRIADARIFLVRPAAGDDDFLRLTQEACPNTSELTADQVPEALNDMLLENEGKQQADAQ